MDHRIKIVVTHQEEPFIFPRVKNRYNWTVKWRSSRTVIPLLISCYMKFYSLEALFQLPLGHVHYVNWCLWVPFYQVNL